MTRLTLAKLKASRVPESLNISSTDSRFLQYANEACERLMQRGKWWGTFGRYALTVDSQIMTLPAFIETVEAIMVSSNPIPLRTQLFEFLGFGWGGRDATLPNGSGIEECLYRGTSPTLKALSTDSIVTLKCDVVDDVGKDVRILGYDANDNWVRTEPAGVGTGWEDGEVISLAQGAGTPSATTWSEIEAIQPPDDLDGQWYLYEGTTAGTLIGKYRHWETAPEYKQYLIPFISTDVTSVVVMAKLAFVPVVNDTDYLCIGNIAALKLACMACKYEEEGNLAMANIYMNGGMTKTGQRITGAIHELEAELSSHLGDGAELGIRLTGSGVGYGDPVSEII